MLVTCPLFRLELQVACPIEYEYFTYAPVYTRFYPNEAQILLSKSEI